MPVRRRGVSVPCSPGRIGSTPCLVEEDRENFVARDTRSGPGPDRAPPGWAMPHHPVRRAVARSGQAETSTYAGARRTCDGSAGRAVPGRGRREPRSSAPAERLARRRPGAAAARRPGRPGRPGRSRPARSAASARQLGARGRRPGGVGAPGARRRGTSRSSTSRTPPRRATSSSPSSGTRPVTPIGARSASGRLAPRVGEAVDQVEAVRVMVTSRSTLARTSWTMQVGVEAVEGLAALPGVRAQRGLQLGDDVLRVEQLDVGHGVVAGLLGGDRAAAVEDEPLVEHDEQPGRAGGLDGRLQVGGGGWGRP